MKELDHKIHGKILRPASFQELFSQICLPSGKYNHRVWMWRGQSDVSWRIDSSAYRRLKSSSNYQTGDSEKDLIRYESNLLQHATHRGYRYSEGRVLTDIELLARLQHHGAATRLVDFTRNALVGLWFACAENIRKSGLLIGFDTWYLGGHEKELENRSYEEIVADLGDYPLITWEPPGISPRIAVQHSQLIYSAVSNSSRGSLVFPEESAFRLFEITPKLKRESLEILTQVFDIDRSVLFPDIDGFSSYHSVSEDISGMHRW